MKDIIIIGGGPGGYVAAIRAAQLGADVTLIEKDSFGGTCLNRGCIPTKTLYRSAEILNLLQRGQEFGIDIKDYNINYSNIIRRKDKVVAKLVAGVDKLLQDNNIDIIKGRAVIRDRYNVEVTLEDNNIEVIKGKNIIIATGSVPIKLPIEGINLDGVMTTRDILECEDIKKDLVIVGGGVVGMEFASIFNAFGCNVSVIEFLPNILSGVDLAIAKRFKAMAKRKKINIMTNSKITKIDRDNSKLQVTYESKDKEKVIITDKVLIAVGRKPNLVNIGLENVLVEYDKKGINVDENYETNIKGIYAIGDVNGKVMLAHAASHQGIRAVENIMGIHNNMDNNVVPSCIFVFPEIACVGMSEQQARDRQYNIKIGKFLFSANGKAMTLGEEEGFVKIISDEKTNEVIGIHILGPHASDLIHEGTLAIQNKLKVEDIVKTIHAHPTLSEAFHEAVLDIDDRGIHIIPNIK